MVTRHRAWRFGNVVAGRMVLSDPGRMVDAVWLEMTASFPRIILDAYVVMPNHVHAIVLLSQEGPAGNPALGDVVQRFKTITTVRYSAGVREREWDPYDGTLWQPEYYDHIIRDRDDLERSRRYIAANPVKWETDRDRDPIRLPDEPHGRVDDRL